MDRESIAAADSPLQAGAAFSISSDAGNSVGNDDRPTACASDVEAAKDADPQQPSQGSQPAQASQPAEASQAPPRQRRRNPVTDKQRKANRENAKKSTGPRTAAGKKTSSQNALDRGLFAAASFLPGEDENEFAALMCEFIDDVQPHSIMERLLVGRLAAISWKLRRLADAETDIGWANVSDRSDRYQGHMEAAVICGGDLGKLGPMPENLSLSHEIFADEFHCDHDSKELQKITQLEMRLTAQMLAVSRQLLQLRKQRVKEEEAAPPRENRRRKSYQTAENRMSDEEVIAQMNAEAQEMQAFARWRAAAQNEPIRVPEHFGTEVCGRSGSTGATCVKDPGLMHCEDPACEEIDEQHPTARAENPCHDEAAGCDGAFQPVLTTSEATEYIDSSAAGHDIGTSPARAGAKRTDKPRPEARTDLINRAAAEAAPAVDPISSSPTLGLRPPDPLPRNVRQDIHRWAIRRDGKISWNKPVSAAIDDRAPGTE